ncbi:MAG: hypothetical protein R2766_11550 [Saprospiraceae bacterium]
MIHEVARFILEWHIYPLAEPILSVNLAWFEVSLEGIKLACVFVVFPFKCHRKIVEPVHRTFIPIMVSVSPSNKALSLRGP